MPVVRFGAVAGVLFATLTGADFARAQPPAAAAKDTPAAGLTRGKLLRVKVTVDSTEERLGDILKEFAAQADREADRPVLWAYGPDFPYAKKITIAIKDKPIDEALDLLFQKAGGGLGYVVVSKDGDKYDGWVRLTTSGERGTAAPDPAAEEEATAAERLAVVKKLIDAGKTASAKPLLTIIVKNYPRTKAGMEAKTLLEKLDK